jgi:hypothetical protein
VSSPAAGRPPEAPEICPGCALPFVQPEGGAPHGRDWRVALRCVNCGWAAEEVLDQETVDRLDEQFDRGTDQLIALLALITECNMREYTTHFVAALEANAILPGDF